MQDNRKSLPPTNVGTPRSPGERDRMIRSRDRQIRRRRIPLQQPAAEVQSDADGDCGTQKER